MSAWSGSIPERYFSFKKWIFHTKDLKTAKKTCKLYPACKTTIELISLSSLRTSVLTANHYIFFACTMIFLSLFTPGNIFQHYFFRNFLSRIASKLWSRSGLTFGQIRSKLFASIGKTINFAASNVRFNPSSGYAKESYLCRYNWWHISGIKKWHFTFNYGNFRCKVSLLDWRCNIW